VEHHVPQPSLPELGKIATRSRRHHDDALPHASQCAGFLQMVDIHHDHAWHLHIRPFDQVDLVRAIADEELTQ